MDNEPTLQLIQCIWYPLQPQVCIGKITTKDHMCQMEHPLWHQVHLESHMTEISKTMLQLTQAHERIANTQQQNHQTMVTVQRQQANAFEALAATTQQQKYDAMFTAVPRYDGTNKKECAVWLN